MHMQRQMLVVPWKLRKCLDGVQNLSHRATTFLPELSAETILHSVKEMPHIRSVIDERVHTITQISVE
jgi:hypothetical protein